jgi:hypothetical protein
LIAHRRAVMVVECAKALTAASLPLSSSSASGLAPLGPTRPDQPVERITPDVCLYAAFLLSFGSSA